MHWRGKKRRKANIITSSTALTLLPREPSAGIGLNSAVNIKCCWGFGSAEELKDTVLWTPWHGTRTLSQGCSIVSWLLFPCLRNPSLPWWATVWTCSLELREGHWGCMKPIYCKGFHTQKPHRVLPNFRNYRYTLSQWGKALSSSPLIKSLLLIVFIQQIFIIEYLQGHSAGKALEQRRTGEPCRSQQLLSQRIFST